MGGDNHGKRMGFKLFLYNLIDASIIKRADRVVAVSLLLHMLEQRGVAKSKMRVINNGISLKRFTTRLLITL